MPTRTLRKIVRIDEEKCDGCGQCVPSCHEGAIRLVNGKARLVADRLCDGLGACLGECPQGAITIEERPAEEFDLAAVKVHLQQAAEPRRSPLPQASGHGEGGCPGSRARMLYPAAAAPAAVGQATPSRLRQWPVQLTLVPPAGPMWQDADVLIAADCVPVACPDFHERLLAGRSLVIACPKLDDTGPYVEKLARIFAGNAIRSVTVAHMEVPCCMGIVRIAEAALAASGRTDIRLRRLLVRVSGQTAG